MGSETFLQFLEIILWNVAVTKLIFQLLGCLSPRIYLLSQKSLKKKKNKTNILLAGMACPLHDWLMPRDLYIKTRISHNERIGIERWYFSTFQIDLHFLKQIIAYGVITYSLSYYYIGFFFSDCGTSTLVTPLNNSNSRLIKNEDKPHQLTTPDPFNLYFLAGKNNNKIKVTDRDRRLQTFCKDIAVTSL